MKNWQKPEMNQVELKQTETIAKIQGKAETVDKGYTTLSGIL